MPREVRYVDEKALRRLFNQAAYYERVQTGEYSERIVYDDEPHTRFRQSPGTRGQRVDLYDSVNTYVATMHHFLRPDGTLGVAGCPTRRESG